MELKKTRHSRSPFAILFLFGLSFFPPTHKALAMQDSSWQLIQDSPLSLQPWIQHTVWEITRPPHKTSDRIGLHRVLDRRTKPKDAIFLFPGTNSNASNLINDEFLANTQAAISRRQDDPRLRQLVKGLKEEIKTAPDRLIARYLAANGYEVYAMDYRTHFVPLDADPKDLGFMKNWGWEWFIEDAKAAMEQAKILSGQKKLYLGGTSFGGMLAMNYAALHWKDDLKGLMLLDGGNGGRWRIRIPLEAWKLVESDILKALPDLPELSLVDGRVSPAVLQAIIDLLGKRLIYQNETYALDLCQPEGQSGETLKALLGLINAIGIPVSFNAIPHFDETRPAARMDILAQPIDPAAGRFLEPFNPKTGKPFDTYLEWNAEMTYRSPLEGLFTNLYEGYNSPLGLAMNQISGDRFWPLEVYLECVGMFKFELTSSDEPVELLGFQIEPTVLPQAVRQALSVLKEGPEPLATLKGAFPKARSWKEEGGKPNLPGLVEELQASPRYDRLCHKIDVPLLVFQSRLGLLFWGPFSPEIANKDATDGGSFPFLDLENLPACR